MHRGCLILLALVVVTVVVQAQLDSLGFISIDCGRDVNSSFADIDTKLTYVSDDQFINTGVNYKIAPQYAIKNLPHQLLTVRSFPEGIRNCYTLRSLTEGSKYLVRGTFMYGNYDQKNKPPIFDVHLGVNYWKTVNITTMDDTFLAEIIATSTSNYLQICLIDRKLGTPFISTLELRPLGMTIYEDVNSTQSLVHSGRVNVGATDQITRYPDDLYDRIWIPHMKNAWTNISTSSMVEPNPVFATPSSVMQTAATTLNTSQSLDVFFFASSNESTVYLIIFHFAEIQDMQSTDLREINLYANGYILYKDYSLQKKLSAGYLSYTQTGVSVEFNASVKATSNSTLPPMLNAVEKYIITPTTGIPTNNEDVTAINAIKTNYKVNKSWSGDPCVPPEYTWAGVNCTFDSTKTPKITSLDFSSSGLAGSIISSFGNISSLKSLDLSDNDLEGDLPPFLDKLSNLTFLDITGNKKLSTILPPSLQSKKQDGNLIFKFENSTEPSKKKKIPVVLTAVVVVVALLLIAAAITLIILYLKRNKNGKINIPKPVESYGSTPLANHHAGHYANRPGVNSPYTVSTGQNYANTSKQNEVEGMLTLENRQFTYNDIMKITKNLQKNIGTGGFGSVYVGILENGTQVAVKMLSHSSSQGVKEFLAEAQNLTRVHHKNLVSLMGYCMDGDCMALVYEYMPQGTLQDKLRGNGRLLTWKQRLQIAYESAQGLEYLHKACNPPLIHRDVKTNNILLNSKLEAKIADFGLSRTFNNASSHVSTGVVGTPGYLDPEYYSSYQLTEKSDVFSFGVVLLEIITSKPPILQGPDGGHVSKWVSKKLSRGEIESIVDPRMQGQHDINSVWKVTELACKCTELSSFQRPTMSRTVSELKESLDLEISTEHTRIRNTTYINPQIYSKNENYVSDVSQDSNFEMAYMEEMPASGPTPR